MSKKQPSKGYRARERSGLARDLSTGRRSACPSKYIARPRVPNLALRSDRTEGPNRVQTLYAFGGSAR